MRKGSVNASYTLTSLRTCCPIQSDSTAGLPAVSGSETAAHDYRKVSTSAGLETRMSWTPSGVKPLYSILGAMWSSMYE